MCECYKFPPEVILIQFDRVNTWNCLKIIAKISSFNVGRGDLSSSLTFNYLNTFASKIHIKSVKFSYMTENLSIGYLSSS